MRKIMALLISLILISPIATSLAEANNASSNSSQEYSPGTVLVMRNDGQVEETTAVALIECLEKNKEKFNKYYQGARATVYAKVGKVGARGVYNGVDMPYGYIETKTPKRWKNLSDLASFIIQAPTKESAEELSPGDKIAVTGTIYFAFSTSIILTSCSGSFNGKTYAYHAFNEPFSIRNGIHYGMKKEEVKDAEAATPLDLEYIIIFVLTHATARYDSYLRYEDITVAGYSDSFLQYGFNSIGELKDITYLIRSRGTVDYDELLNKLTSKYGKPDFYEPTVFETEAVRFLADTTFFPYYIPIIYDIRGWLIRYNDCYVSIELVDRRLNRPFSSIRSVLIGYRLLSFSEYDNLVNRINKNRNEINESIDNDL